MVLLRLQLKIFRRSEQLMLSKMPFIASKSPLAPYSLCVHLCEIRYIYYNGMESSLAGWLAYQRCLHELQAKFNQRKESIRWIQLQNGNEMRDGNRQIEEEGEESQFLNHKLEITRHTHTLSVMLDDYKVTIPYKSTIRHMITLYKPSNRKYSIFHHSIFNVCLCVLRFVGAITTTIFGT